MSLFEKIKDKLIPEPSAMPIPTSASGGVGNRRGALGFEDDVSNFCSLVHITTVVSRLQARCHIFVRSEPPLRNHVHLLTSCP